MKKQKTVDLKTMIQGSEEKLIEKILQNKKVDRETDCWLWTGRIDKHGYGRIHIGGKHGTMAAIHRLSAMLFDGKDIKDLCVLHKCDNRKCFNPEHLFYGSHADNAFDRAKKGRNGHQRLTNEDVREIKRRVANGEQKKIIAKDYNIDPQRIWMIMTGKLFKYVV